MSTHPVTSVDMLRKLVSFDTTSRNSNLKLIEYVQEYLGAGVTAGTTAPGGTTRF